MKRFAILTLLVAISAGCASIIHGTSQDVGVNSVPSGARVLVDNQPLGATPIVAHLKRSDNHIIQISMNGYEPVKLTVTKKVSGWIAGNIIFGGLIGLAVDAIDGAMYQLTPEQVAANLNKSVGSIERADGLLYVSVVLRPDPSWKRIGTLKRD
jgi:hypothetical protein